MKYTLRINHGNSYIILEFNNKNERTLYVKEKLEEFNKLKIRYGHNLSDLGYYNINDLEKIAEIYIYLN